jgi:hypothetical protein
MTKTVDAIWDYFLAIWTERNGELHGRNYEEQRAIALETTRDEVTKIYEASQRMSMMPRVLFFIPDR